MNWQSDFVSPHIINGVGYMQSTSKLSNANLMPAMVAPSAQPITTNGYVNNNYNQSSRYTTSISPQFNSMTNNHTHQSSYTTTTNNSNNLSYIPASVSHFSNVPNSTSNSYSQSSSPVNNNNNNNNKSNNNVNNSITTANNANNNPNAYQMPIAHATISPSTALQYSYNNSTGIINPINYSSTQYHYQSSKNLVLQIIESLRRNNIKLIGFDFDCTIVNIHTGGQWCDSAEKLAEFVRPCFRELLPALLKCPDFFVCVVTYSPQEELIREVLRTTMKDEYAVNDLVNKIIIKGNTREFVEEHGIENCYSNGKQIHLKFCRDFFESLIRKFNKENNNSSGSNGMFKINDDSILLVDDDLQNLKIAYENGHLAFQVNNSIQLVDIYNFLDEI